MHLVPRFELNTRPLTEQEKEKQNLIREQMLIKMQEDWEHYEEREETRTMFYILDYPHVLLFNLEREI